MLTPLQMLLCIRTCQTLSDFYKDIHLFRHDETRNEIYILAGDSLSVRIAADRTKGIEIEIEE